MPPIPSTMSKLESRVASRLSTVQSLPTEPLWAGPCDDGEMGGVTQSMLHKFLACRERFRLRYVLGLRPTERWSKTFGYGNMWHACEESLARGTGRWDDLLHKHVEKQLYKYPTQREEITRWYAICMMQFPEYVAHWIANPDVVGRTPLMQEQVFDVRYTTPLGRVVRLRGKYDSVDLIDAWADDPDGVWLQENKSKGDIDEQRVARQLRFDLQTMTYLVALLDTKEDCSPGDDALANYPVLGVRYNVVRRPLSGGVGMIRPHAAKSTKNKFTPAETEADFVERLRRDYIATDPAHWFFRIKSRVTEQDVVQFKQQLLDPILDQLCWWYDEVVDEMQGTDARRQAALVDHGYPPTNWRHPFGGWNALDDAGETEYDEFLATGSLAGLRRATELFPELKEEV